MRLVTHLTRRTRVYEPWTSPSTEAEAAPKRRPFIIAGVVEVDEAAAAPASAVYAQRQSIVVSVMLLRAHLPVARPSLLGGPSVCILYEGQSVACVEDEASAALHAHRERGGVLAAASRCDAIFLIWPSVYPE